MGFWTPLRAALTVASLLLGPTAWGQTPVLIKEVVSREVSIHVGGIQYPEIQQIVSREASLFILNGPAEPFPQVISREVSFAVATPEAPPLVTNYVVTPSPIGDRVTLNWNNYNQWAVRDVARFDIYLSDRPFNSVTAMTPFLSLPAETVSTTLTNLPTWRDHFFAIVAVDVLSNANQNVIYSAAYIISPQTISREVSLFVGAEPDPPYRQVVSREVSLVSVSAAAPTAIARVATSNSPIGDTVNLDWSAYNQWAERDIAGFNIYFSDKPFFNVSNLTIFATVPGERTSVSFTGLPTWRDHFFAVVPIDGLGNASNQVNYAGVYVISPQSISREVSLFTGAEPNPPYKQVVSREASIVVTDTNVPAPVTGLNSGFTAATSESVYRALDLNWNSYNELAQRDVVRYRVYVDTAFFDNVIGMQPFAIISNGVQVASLNGFFHDHIYFVAVVAEDALGNFNPIVRSTLAQASNRSIWRRGFFTSAQLSNPLLEPTLWGNEADPDGDKVINLVEYALGGNLQAPSKLNLAGTASLLPVPAIVTVGNERFYELRFRRRVGWAELGLGYEIGLSRNLSDWFSPNTLGQGWTFATEQAGAAEAGMTGFEPVALRLATPLSQIEGGVFSRTKVSIAESSSTPSSLAIGAAQPVAYWRLDELPGATNATDSAGSRHGAISNGVLLAQLPTPGRGYAARFSGETNSVIDVAPFQIGTNLTVEAWVRLDTAAPSGRRYVVLSRSDGSYSLEISDDGRARFTVQNNSGVFASAATSTAPVAGQWHHLVGTFGAGSVTLRTNGVVAAIEPLPGTLMNAGSNADRIIIGGTATGASTANRFQGYLDEVAIFDRVLSPTQIASHHLSGQ